MLNIVWKHMTIPDFGHKFWTLVVYGVFLSLSVVVSVLIKWTQEAMWQKCVLLCVTLTRLEGQPCLSISSSSRSSSCVTSTQCLRSNLKGPGLPVSLPTHPRTPAKTTSQMPPTPHPHPFCPELPENTHSCTLSVMHTDKHPPYQQQQTVAWLAGCWQSPDSACLAL